MKKNKAATYREKNREALRQKAKEYYLKNSSFVLTRQKKSSKERIKILTPKEKSDLESLRETLVEIGIVNEMQAKNLTKSDLEYLQNG